MSKSTATLGLIHQYSGGDYDKLTTGQKIDIFQNVSSITYKTIITDLLKEINTLGWDSFFVEPTKFGKGYRILTTSLGNVEQFSDDPRQRYPNTRNILRDYEQIITDKAQLRARITTNEPEMTFYFKNAEGMNEFLTMQRGRIIDTFKQTYQDTMVRMFGDGTWPIKTATENAKEYVTLVDTIRGNIKNKISAQGTTLLEKVVWILKFIRTVSQLTTDMFNIGDDGTDTNFIPAFNNVTLDDLVLIMSNDDAIDFTTLDRANTYNKELLDWPKLKIMELPIPSGTFYLLDKKAIQISPNRNVTYTQFYPNTLDTDIIHHMWSYMGIFKYAFGLKINFVSSGGTTIEALKTALKTRYTPTTPAATGKK